MSDKFQNKYRIPSARLQNWDYRVASPYFITICTADRKHYFGKIKDKKMILSNVGVIADLMWHEIKNHQENIELGQFVVMPNHIHGILILKNHNVETLHATSEIEESEIATSENVEPEKTVTPENINEINPNLSVQTLRATSLPQFMTSISPKSNSISTIIRSYKSAVTKHANRLGYEFAWQDRFHDHIIKNENSFENIQNYIENNPFIWENDKFYDSE